MQSDTRPKACFGSETKARRLIRPVDRKGAFEDLDERQTDLTPDEICGESLTNLRQDAVWPDDEEYILPRRSGLRRWERFERSDARVSLDGSTMFSCRQNIVADDDQTDESEHDNRGISHVLCPCMRIIPQSIRRLEVKYHLIITIYQQNLLIQPQIATACPKLPQMSSERQSPKENDLDCALQLDLTP